MKTAKIFLSIALLSGVLFSGGCMGKRTNPVRDGTAAVKVIHPPDQICLHGVRVYQYENELVIYGNVHRNFRAPYWFAKHIDVAVLGPDGTRLDEVKTQGRFYPFPEKRTDSLSFTVCFSRQLPIGAAVVVAYHGNIGSTKVTDACIRNLNLETRN